MFVSVNEQYPGGENRVYSFHFTKEWRHGRGALAGEDAQEVFLKSPSFSFKNAIVTF